MILGSLDHTFGRKRGDGGFAIQRVQSPIVRASAVRDGWDRAVLPGQGGLKVRAFTLPLLAACTFLLPLLIRSTAAGQSNQQSTGDMHALGEATVDQHTVDAQSIDVQTIFRLANEHRATQGLPALSWSPELATAAQAHAQRMAESSTLSHQYPGELELSARSSQTGAHFSSLAENIARGFSASQIDREWTHSPPHRANLLDPRMNTLGVAVVSSGGTLYAVEDFAASVPLLTPSLVEQTVEAELRTLRVPARQSGLMLRSREEARQNCPLSQDLLPGSQARFVLRWEGSSLTLPQPLVNAAESGRYSAAAVGSCAVSQAASASFVVYRVTVLLY